MKYFITKFSKENLGKLQRPIYLHYTNDCIRLTADFNDDKEHIPNSGITKLDFTRKEILLQNLIACGAVRICNTCQEKDYIETFDNEQSNNTFLQYVVENYEELERNGKFK
jgi:hypothetical protein